MGYGQNIQIIDPETGAIAYVTSDNKLRISGDVRLSTGDIQIGSVEIKDRDSNDRADVGVGPSGDYGLQAIAMEVNPLHTSQANPSYSFTRNGSGYLTKVKVVIAGVTYTKDFGRDANNDVTAVTAWY